MSSNGTKPPRKLHGIDLRHPVDALLRKIEMSVKKSLREDVLERTDHGPVVGHFDDTGAPHVGLARGETAMLEDVALEVFRMDLRHGCYEKNMPYAEMKNEANRRFCRRLYRILEQEVVLSEVEACGIRARARIIDRLLSSAYEPMRGGAYRKGEADPGRTREGALDALELIVSECDSTDAKNHMTRLGELEPLISRPLGLMY
ncbi:MAG: hypothetical protein ACRELB_22190, partial [Polyangiaceae bacterium]